MRLSVPNRKRVAAVALATLTAAVHAETVSYTGPPVAIPDNTPAGVNIYLPVNGVGAISDFNFRFDTGSGVCNAAVGNTNAAVDHTFVGDLTFKLTSPGGTTVTFMSRRGGTRENICGTNLDDEGGFANVSTITSVTGSPISGSFSPETTGMLNGFDVQNANGTWVLNVSDNAGLDTGSVRRFSLIFHQDFPYPPPMRGVLAYDASNNLVYFTSSNPGLVSSQSLNGLNPGEVLRGLDFRPADGLLYAVGATGSVERVLRIETRTRRVAPVSAVTPITAAGSFFGLDFNPLTDRLREVSNADVNRRFNPDLGTLAGIDADLAYVPGDPNAGANPNIVHVAYSNNTAGTSTTTLYGIDSTTDSLVRIGGVDGVPSPDTGQLTTIGPLGVAVASPGGFDIQAGTGAALAALQVGGASILYSINLTTGAATAIGPIGSGTVIDGLAIISPPGKGDFNGDGQTDLLYRSVANGAQNKVWLMNGTTRISEAPIAPDAASADWLIRGADDFDSAASPGSGRDGKTDLVFWNQTTGAVEFWLMNGSNRLGTPVALTGAAPLPTNWHLSAIADFDNTPLDNNRWPDIVWRNFSSQKIVIWKMRRTLKYGSIIPTPDAAVDANWLIVAAAQYNDDSNTDLLWYNSSSGKLVTWYMDHNVVRTAGQFTTPAAAGDNNWKVVASADYSRNDPLATPPFGSPDIVWRNDTSGNQVVWHLDFASVRKNGLFTTPPANSPALDWVIVGPR